MSDSTRNTPQRVAPALQARIDELTTKGYTARAAERVARNERRLRSPRHKAAIARRVEAATMRFEATGDYTAFNSI